jgi:hypothetical protein
LTNGTCTLPTFALLCAFPVESGACGEVAVAVAVNVAVNVAVMWW